MIIKKCWTTRKYKSNKKTVKRYEGWFLLGIIPLYLKVSYCDQ